MVKGLVSLLAGDPAAAGAGGSYADTGATGPGSAARFDTPQHIVHDPVASVLYVADAGNLCIRVVKNLTAAGGGVVTTLAGRCRPSAAPTAGVDGPFDSAAFVYPTALALDARREMLYVADTCAVRRVVVQTGEVSTVAGGACGPSVDGVGTLATFAGITGLAYEPFEGALIVSDFSSSRLRKVNLYTLQVTTISVGVLGAQSRAGAIALDPTSGAVIVADSTFNALSVAANTTTRGGGLPPTQRALLAGTPNRPASPLSTTVNGFGSVATFSIPSAVAIDPATGLAFVTDAANGGQIRTVTLLHLVPAAAATTTTARRASSPVCDGRWHHLARSYAGGSNGAVRTYLDGDLFAQSADSLAVNASRGIRIGWSGNASDALGGDYFEGALSEVRVYARELSPDEVRSLSLPVVSVALGAAGYITPSTPSPDLTVVYAATCSPGSAGPISSFVRDPLTNTWGAAPPLACTACRGGEFAVGGEPVCQGSLCPPGQWGQASAKSAAEALCKDCASGLYTANPGETSCFGSVCPPGSFGAGGQNNAFSATCSLCPSGQFTTSAGQTACLGAQCPPGTSGSLGSTANVSLAIACSPCSAGMFMPTSGAGACSGGPCWQGSFGPRGMTTQAAATCTFCPPGQWTSSRGMSACQGTPCPLGTFGTAGNYFTPTCSIAARPASGPTSPGPRRARARSAPRDPTPPPGP
jgi:hypothetical protein